MTTVRGDVDRMDEEALDRARSGESEAFARLVEPHRRELLVHCYRTLGSLQDAEDVLQEVLTSAWRSLDRFDGRALRPWLYRIAVNRCLNHVRDASRRPRPAATLETDRSAGADDGPWWLEPIPDTLLDAPEPGPEARYDARESIALSFIAGLQHLPVRQRAVLVLRDVLGLPAAEVAAILDTTPTSVNSTLIRARSGFRPDRSIESIPVARSSDETVAVERFVDAFQSGDARRVAAVLTEDVRLSMPPEPIRCTGPDAVSAFLQDRGFWGPDLQLVATRANGQPAFGYYLPDATTEVAPLNGLVVLTIDHGDVAAITRFGLGALDRFDLPPRRPRPH